MGELDKKKEETIDEKNESVEKEENAETFKMKIGTVGNFVYYLIHAAKDDYDKQYNEIISDLTEGNLIVNETTDEEGANTVADIIDSAISTGTNTSSVVSTDENTKKLMNESLVVLYNGLILDTSKMDEVSLKYLDSKKDESEKYIITYYSYENYSYRESKLGTFSQQLYDGLVKIDNVGKIAISEDYEAIPRDVKVVNTVPTIVSENNAKISDYDSVKTLIVDLDGNASEEYILILANKTTGFSKITLIDSKGAKVADLASIEKSKWKKDANTEYYLSYTNVEVIDIDNDGIMEIVVEIPHATGDPTVSLVKYNNGILTGKTGIECSLLAE